MDECCEVREIPREQRRVLHVVLWINVVMFLVESVAGILANSTALFADSVDMLGDAIVYGFSLYVGPSPEPYGRLTRERGSDV